MDTSALLQHAHLSVVAPTLDPELARVHDVVQHKVVVSGREDLEAALCALLAASDAVPVSAKTLDLIGHAGSDAPLVLGDWVIDADRAPTRAFLRELADLEVLPRLGVHSLRLLGCASGLGQRGRQTIVRLA